VAVIGAGNTAIDAANAARRLGATNVAILYRRSERDMSAFAFEYEHAKQEGVRFLWCVIPVSIHADATGIRSLECAQAKVAENGVLESVAGRHFHFDCQQIIYAIGQSPLLDLLSACRCLELSHGRVVVDRTTGATSSPKYFAGGDCVNGGREVVDAVADGKRSGIAIAQALEPAHA
jgi:glutamate synthase (NADPH/NADH) small chain